MKKIIYILFCLLTVVALFSCFNEREDGQTTETTFDLFSDGEVKVKSELKNNSHWKPADKIKAKIHLKENKLVVEFNFSDLEKELLNGIVYKGDTLRSTMFNMQLLCNGKLVGTDFIKGSYNACNDSSCVFYSSVTRLKANMLDKIQIPLYALKDFPANSKVQLQLRLWQDCFMGEEIWTKKKIGNYNTTYIYRDTLNKKLIDNVYSFSVTVPEIYKTEIVCDSLILQNDSAWSPYGSDNTIWNSSLPDIYFSVLDEFWNEQSSSHIEKSCSIFNTPDTLAYYHYKPDEIIRISVYDHDNLSRDDVLGSWKGSLDKVKNRMRYRLKFDHVEEFYLHKIEKGLQN